MPKKKKESDEDTVPVSAPVAPRPKPREAKMTVFDFANIYAERRQNVESAGAFIVQCQKDNCEVATRKEFEEKFATFLASPPQ